jgi:hypothetical protein
MPIPNPAQGESQNEYVGRCISDINEEYPNEQAVAICISNWQKTHMSKDASQRVAMKMEGIRLYQTFAECGKMKAQLAENPQLDYPHDMCVKDMMEKYGDQYTAERICKCIVDTYSKDGVELVEEGGLEGACWEGYIAIGTKEKDGRMVPNCVPAEEVMAEIESKGIKLAEDGKSLPWEDCIKKMADEGYSEESQKNICGYIKSQYGS